MYVTGQLVFTPRSKSITGIPAWQAFSTAGVSGAVVFGETISASHFLFATRSAMSAICWSSLAPASTGVKVAISGWSFTSACMSFQPTTRQGLSTAALLKQRLKGPVLRNLLVSTIVGLIACIHGWSAGPVAGTERWASCLSKSAWTKNLGSAPVPLPAVWVPPPVEPHAVG